MSNINSDSEIDLIEIFKNIYNSKKIIFYSTSLFVFVGVAVALLSPEKFSSSTIFMPQNQESTSSPLSGVANLVGINLGSSYGSGDIPTSIYPQIGKSPKFKRLLLKKFIDKKNNLTLKDFFINHYNLKVPVESYNTINSSLVLPKLEEECFEIISEIISITVNEKEGFVIIESLMPIAEYSAIIANYSREILQKIIIENKIETARQNLNFSEQQLAQKKLEFDQIQSKLAYFSDSNLNSVNSFVINEKDKLNAEFQIISAVVTELAKQVEQSKLQVKKETPVFSTIKQALIPNKRASPKRTQLVLVFTVFGFILSCIFIIIKNPIRNILNQIKS
tara:strand:- start:35917 stop:36921 length:1005 start_codon:yes stop_codon:yes gene_type:complete